MKNITRGEVKWNLIMQLQQVKMDGI